MIFGAACGAKVVDCLSVDREKPHCRTILGGHVGDGGTIGQRQLLRSLSVKLDELPDHLGLAQHLRDGQRQIGCGDTLAQRALEPNTYDIRR